VVFMKKVTAWGASKSYWIDVAKLAWIPKIILDEARTVLKNLEENKTISNWGNQNIQPQWLFSIPKEVHHDAEYEKMKTMLNGMDLNNITPLQALQILVKIKESL
jgi:DNA mismatch repair protein MutS